MKDISDRIIGIIIVWILVDFAYAVFKQVMYNIKINKSNPSWKKAAKAFGIRVGKLKKMSKDEIKKMYRNLSKVHHPDVGGNEEDFKNLHKAYEFAYAHAN